jgi:hypothetical protein
MNQIMTRDQLVSWLYENGPKFPEPILRSMITLTVILNRPNSRRRTTRIELAKEWNCQPRWAHERLRDMSKLGLLQYEMTYAGEFASYYFFRLGPEQS